MGFLSALANQMNNQLSLGENTNRSLDSIVDGQNVKFGSLGQIASKIDTSAERRYVEEGYLRVDPYNADPKQYEILMQEPNATVLIKKKMFSSIAENFRPDYMDQDEKLYYKCIKVLFQNKCKQISALEALSKIQKINAATGNVSDKLMPLILTLSDTVTSIGSNIIGSVIGGSTTPDDVTHLANVTDQIRKLYAFNTTNPLTTWITDSTNLFQSQFGQGTGVIEITNFTNLTTSVSVDGLKNPGSFSLSISDPYEMMLITEWDIEKAISDATNMFNSHNIFQFGQQAGDQVINDTQNQLNQIRSARGASPIVLKVSPDTLLGKRVTAILDRIGIELLFTYDSSGGTGFPGLGGFGNSVTVAPDYLFGGAIAGNDGLNANELGIFNSLIAATFNKLQLEANSRNSFQTSNKNTNYSRKKLRFNFAGKLIIQPMDVVHIYVNSKSMYDNKLLSGLNNMFTGMGVVQSINAKVTDIKNTAGALFNPSGDFNFQSEKAAFVGSDFPNSLWNLLRSSFVAENEGTHIFAGVVENATDGWANGKFTIDVRGKDNTYYFDQGKVNFKPGIDVFNGAIFDPLTPFKSNFDTISSNFKDDVPQLLDENVAILGTSQNKKGLLKSKSGPNAGQKVTSDNFVKDSIVDNKTGSNSKIFFAPDGLVYKWKEGIGVYVQFGNSLDLNDPNKVGNPNIAKNPFAGQDVMNVISLLVTGQPYNYANFWRASQNIDGFGRDSQGGQSAANSFISSLKNDLVKSNTLWGNFIPFKNLVIDPQTFSLAMQAQTLAISRNNDLDSKIQKLKDLDRQAAFFGASSIFSDVSTSPNPQFLIVQAQANVLQKSIQSDIDAVQKEESTFNKLATSSGADATFDYTDFVDSSKANIAPSDSNVRKSLSRQINYLTRRMSYNVRANEDKNLFIVDDSYDKDYDILGYETSLEHGISLYNNDYTSIREKINNAADILNLEVFADTQGHIRVRPPQYNRMPSSVFYRMMYLKKSYGVQIFPQFIDDLFGDQISTLKQRIEIVEDLIRLDCAILNNNNDDSAAAFIKTTGASSNIGSSFNFISDSTGLITDISALIKSANPDQNSSVQSFLTNSGLQTQATSNNIITNSQRYSAIVTILQAQAIGASGFFVQDISQFQNNTYIDDLIKRIQTKSGQQISKNDYIVDRVDGVKDIKVPSDQTIDIFKVTQELQNKLIERQKVVKLFYSTIKNAVEIKSLDTQSDDTTSNQLIAPAIYGNSNVPEIFEHMIEDETYNDYGSNSGNRFIIKRSQIRSLQIAETSPDYTMIQINGKLDPLLDALPSELNSFPDNGSGLITAVAVDYDAWRNYGFKNTPAINVPFLNNPNSQCAPYASMILSRNRKNILRGTITISGNEFMQPGEVIFLQDRGLLFYVNKVSHTFNFGSNFTTTLDLSYGHTPGEYIPTILDVIGKMIYKNKDSGAFTIQRQSNSGNEISLGVVIMDPNTNSSGLSNISDSSSESPNAPQSTFANFNNATINNILYTAAYRINANNTVGNNVIAKVELRIYYDNANSPNSQLRQFVQQVKDILTGQSSGTNSSSTGTSFNQSFASKDVIIGGDAEINLDDDKDRRSPSQQAIDASRNQADVNHIAISANSIDVSTDKIRSALFGYIVDCWITFKDINA